MGRVAITPSVIIEHSSDGVVRYSLPRAGIIGPMASSQKRRTHEVFGVSNTILEDSYVDRGDLDERLAQLLNRQTHIAVRGASKCGKSWLRQSVIRHPLVVQCRLGEKVSDIYTDALSELGIKLDIDQSTESSSQASLEAQTDLGLKLLARLGTKVGLQKDRKSSRRFRVVGKDLNDLSFIAQILKTSRRRLVIEDFHYLSIAERQAFAFDLKTLWDLGVFVVIVGVWSKQNMLLSLNPDLTGRVEELSIVWAPRDLESIFWRGGGALNLRFSEDLMDRAVEDAFGNAGLLQQLIIRLLDELSVQKEQDYVVDVGDVQALEAAAMSIAEQLEPLYQALVERVSYGIRKRKGSTGIYAHAMAAILEAADFDLVRGLSLDRIYRDGA